MTTSLYKAALLHGRAYRILKHNVAGVLKSFDLNLHEWVLLSVLSHHNTLRSTELAHEIGVEVPAITQLTLELEKRGYIARQMGSEDRRQRFFSLTKNGELLVRNCEVQLEKELTGYFSGVSLSDMKGHLRVLEQIIEKHR